jgi:energy-coupling factor transporter ATP-binding protein EcfA2
MVDAASQIPGAVHKLLEKAGVYERVLHWLLRRSATEVLVVGPSGAGKSSFLSSLKGDVSIIRRDLRTDKVRKVAGKLKASHFQFWDTPGEVEHEPKREVAYKELGRLKTIGIINVVSYGFHEGTAERAKAIDNGGAADAYLESRRAVEIAQLREWVDRFVGSGGSAKWLMTVVTKADLWWQDGDDQPVIDYYRNGDYRVALGQRISTTPHIVLPHSSHAQKFYQTVPVSGHYTEEHRQRDRAQLIAHLLENASEL